MNLQEFYASRVTDYNEKAEVAKAKYIRFSIVRLILFVTGFGLFIYVVTALEWWISVVYVIVFLIGFARFVF